MEQVCRVMGHNPLILNVGIPPWWVLYKLSQVPFMANKGITALSKRDRDDVCGGPSCFTDRSVTRGPIALADGQ